MFVGEIVYESIDLLKEIFVFDEFVYEIVDFLKGMLLLLSAGLACGQRAP